MKHFGEIIESTPTHFKTRAWHWHTYPPLGSLVVVERDDICLYGLIQYLETGSFDTSRQPFPYQKTEEELLQEQPQLFAFLHTICTSLVVGHEENEHLYYHLPPYPPKIHAFVRPATQEEVQRFCSDYIYLQRILTPSTLPLPADELLLAFLSHIARQGLLTPAYLEGFIHTMTLISDTRYRSLKLFLQRAEPLLKNIAD